MLKVRLYDLKQPQPMFQALAIKGIMRSLGGKLLAAGEVDQHPIPLDPIADEERGGYYLYLKCQKGNVAETIWYDDGTGVRCVAHKIEPAQEWTKVEPKH